jgi:hypothetical protein
MAASLESAPFVAGPRYGVLVHLARYRFLTVAQLLRLGAAPNKDRIYALLRDLELQGLIKRRQNNRLRSEPDIFWLTKTGASYVDPADVEHAAAPRTLNITGEIWHRLAIIDAHIALRLWAAAAAWHVDWVKTDFATSAAGKRATTTPMRGGIYVPDATALVTGPDQVQRLLVFEIYWRGAAGLHHFRRKIENVRDAATSHAVEKHHGVEATGSAARYLVSFADSETRQKACSALPDPAAKAWRQFFFADHPGLLSDFKTAWHDAAGTPRPLFGRVGSP